MDPVLSALLELVLFFVIFPVTFKALMALDITSFFRKGAVWQIQITYIFLSIALAYLVTSGLMQLINLSTALFNRL